MLLESEASFGRLYGKTGRPTWSVARMLGLLILRELLGVESDQAVVEALSFDMRWQHALDVHDERDVYLSRRSLTGFRSRLAQHDPEGELLRGVFDRVSEQAIGRLGLSVRQQRTDSTFVVSNMTRRNRKALLQEVLRLMVAELARRQRLGELPEALRQWFDRYNGWTETMEEQSREWLEQLVAQYGQQPDVAESEAFRTMQVVLSDVAAEEQPPDKGEEGDDEPPPPETRGPSPEAPQNRVRHRKTQARSRRKKKRGRSRQSLPSPHDPDARKGRKGVGYNAHLTETCGNGVGVEILTDIDVVPAHTKDSTQLPKLLQRLKAKGQLPQQLYADGAYPTLANAETAQDVGVQLRAPVHRGNLGTDHPKLSREHFAFDGEQLTACPAGHAPTRWAVLRSSAVAEPASHALFAASTCRTCPTLERCPTQTHNAGRERKLCLHPALRERDALLEWQRTAQWRKDYAIRAGVEATASELKRTHGLRRLPVRGLVRVRQRAFAKGIACNAKRLVRAVAA